MHFRARRVWKWTLILSRFPSSSPETRVIITPGTLPARTFPEDENVPNSRRRKEQRDNLAYLEKQHEDDPLVVLVLLYQWMGSVAVHLGLADPAVRDPGVGYAPAQAHVEGVNHAVGGVEPAEGLQDVALHGPVALAVYGRAADALAGEGEAAREQQGDRSPVVKSEYQGVLGGPLDLEQRPDWSEHVNHLQHDRHIFGSLSLGVWWRNS